MEESIMQTLQENGYENIRQLFPDSEVYGYVYLAERSNTTFVIKTHLTSNDLLQAELEHPSIPRVHEYNYEEDYMVMEYIPGECAGDVFWRAGSQTWKEWCALRDSLFSVMAYLSINDIRYRDLNGGNVIKHSETGKYYLIDFGQARREESPTNDRNVLELLRIASYGLCSKDKEKAEQFVQSLTPQDEYQYDQW